MDPEPKFTWLLVYVLLLNCLTAFSLPATSDAFNLVILHTNDIHSRFETFNRKEIACKPNPARGDKRCYGGISRRAGFVDLIRRENKNVLLLDAGDQFQGTPWFYTYKGVEASHFLNKLRYDAMALGNHEFDNGVDGLVPFLNNVTVPILCSNLVKDAFVPEKMNQSILEHRVVEMGGRKIGIIGYITSKVPTLSKTGNLSFLEEKEVLKKQVELLKGKEVKIIIALGHSGLRKDKEMAAELSDVDIIVGGHSHSLLYNGINEFNDSVSDTYPVKFNHDDGRSTLVVQSGSFGKYVGLLNLTFDPEGKVTSFSGNPVVMDESIPEDPEVKHEMELLLVEVDEKFNFVIGRSLVPLDASENICRVSECNIGNLITDAMVDYVRVLDRWKNLLIAFINGGSLRASLQEGDITYGDILTIWPFSEGLVIVQVNGSTLLEVLEQSVRNFSWEEKSGKFLQFSGLKVTFDLTKPDGHRVVKVKVKDCYSCSTYKDLEMEKMYDVVTQSYLVDGGDGYTVLRNFKDSTVPIGFQSTDALIEYLKQHSPVNPIVDGRMTGLEKTPDTRETIDGNASRRNNFDGLVYILAVFLSAVMSRCLTI